MEVRKPGRPKKLKLVDMKRTLEIIKEQKLKKGVDPGSVKLPVKATIYNKIHAKLIHNYGGGKGHPVLLDEDEIIEKLCS